MASGAINVPVVTTFDSKGIDKAVSTFKKLDGGVAKTAYAMRTADSAVTNVVKSLGKFALVGAGIAGAVGGKLVKFGSDLAESQSKVNVVFGQSSKVINDFASKSADSLGMSTQKALEATSTYGNLFQAFGVGQSSAATMSTSLVQLAGDLASFNNANPEDVLLALRSGLSGEAEPLKRYGIAINDARLKQEAFNMGLYNGKGNLDITAKSQAAYALIMKDSSLAQGDYARTASGVANTTRSLKANFEDVAAQLGTYLIPVFQKLLGFVKDEIIPRLKGFADALNEKGLGGALKYAAGEFTTFLADMGAKGNIILAAVTAILALKAAVVAYQISTALATTITKAFGIEVKVATIGSFGLIVAAIVAVIVIIIALYMKFEWFRKGINFIINAVIGYVEFMVNMWIKAINMILHGINAMIRVANFFGADLNTIGMIGEVSFGRIGDAADNAKAKMQKATQAIADVNAKYENSGKVIKKVTGEEEKKDEQLKGGGATIETAKQKLDKYITSLQGLTGAQKALKDSNSGIIKSDKEVLRSKEALAKAQDTFNKLTKGYGVGSAESVKQSAKVAQASRDLTKANMGIKSSVDAVREAELALKTLREGPTAKDTEDAEIGLTKKKFALEQANFDVADAEKNLADIRLDPESSAQAIREAEIKLAESKFGVRDATFAVATAEAELKKLRKNTPTAQQIKQAEDDLTNAKLANEEAIQAQADATTNLTTEQTLLEEITYGVKEGTDKYKDALADLQQAQEDFTNATDQQTEAYQKQRDAVYELKKAEEELAASRGTVTAGQAATGNAIVTGNTVLEVAKKPGMQYGSFMEAVNALHPNAKALDSKTPVVDSRKAFPALYKQYKDAGLAMAQGGIVTRPTQILAGEAGPEAIIPLSKMGGNNIYITVNAGMGADGVELGKQIIDAIKTAERRNGKVFASA
jgi:hypothetical protein